MLKKKKEGWVKKRRGRGGRKSGGALCTLGVFFKAVQTRSHWETPLTLILAASLKIMTEDHGCFIKRHVLFLV